MVLQHQKSQWLQMENMKNISDLGFTSKTCCPQSPGTVGLVYRLQGELVCRTVVQSVWFKVSGVSSRVRAHAYDKIEYVRIGTCSSKTRMRMWYAFSMFEDLRSLTLKYYFVKLPTAIVVRLATTSKLRHFRCELWIYNNCTALSLSFLLWCIVCILLVSTYAVRIEYVT